jgi:hypothetical protein
VAQRLRSSAGEPPAEVCNGVDDDCDGVVDEGVANACGGCAGVQQETCNNLDDDCDGVVDNQEGIDERVGAAVRRRRRRLHQRASRRCEAGVWSVQRRRPPRRICDGLDNDCDGVVDGMTRSCGERQSASLSTSGPRRASTANWGACIGAIGPDASEKCDGIDNDCDGNVDEGNPGGA